MRIGIDIDNVIADTYKDLNPYVTRYFGKETTSEQAIELMRDNKWLQLHYWFKAWRYGLPTTLSLIDGAVDTIRDWHNNHEIIMITSRLPIFKRQTRKWLEKHGIPYHELHHAKEKTKHTKAEGCEVFIEDNLEECEILADFCKQIFLFDHPWNRKEIIRPNIIRVKSWQEIRNNLSL
ncbi:MAG: hypothetical protein NT099_00325 [Candidatus Saganbacteria bacterium]|nr:hypothetical protein [Candidatus Saganbacteria bacterium]